MPRPRRLYVQSTNIAKVVSRDKFILAMPFFDVSCPKRAFLGDETHFRQQSVPKTGHFGHELLSSLRLLQTFYND